MQELLIHSLVVQAPTVLACLLGLVLAAVFVTRFPAPAGMAGAAFAILLMLSAIMPFIERYLIGMIQGGPNLGYVLAGVAFVASTIRALAYLLLLAAVFRGRK